MLRHVLYMTILLGGGKIFEAMELLRSHEAFLVSGLIAVLAVLLLEPRKEKIKALFYFAMVMSLYGFWFKLPVMLEGSLNYYVIKLIAVVLIVAVGGMVYVLDRKLLRSFGDARTEVKGTQVPV